jgi:LmbE family N-acetylglucosaminyl deacetylase
MNLYKDFVRATVENLENAKKIPLGAVKMPLIIPRKPDAPVGMIFAPHPDDECISGGLPLRLFRENGFRIINIPVTLGSHPARRAERTKELENACRYLGFEIEFAQNGGFEHITPEARQANPQNWDFAIEKTCELIEKFQPKILFFPHERDRHPAHCGTNLLVLDALEKMPGDFTCVTVENEFWQALDAPNCLVELGEEIVSDLINALTFHTGEVERNPYHLTFPSWLIDNVRRGSEIIAKPGADSQNFTFGALHKISLYKNGALSPLFSGGAFLSMKKDLSPIFKVSKLSS